MRLRGSALRRSLDRLRLERDVHRDQRRPPPELDVGHLADLDPAGQHGRALVEPGHGRVEEEHVVELGPEQTGATPDQESHQQQGDGAHDEGADDRRVRAHAHPADPPASCSPSREERPHLRLGALVAELLRIAQRDHGPRLGVEEHGRVGDGEDAGELVRHHDHRRPETRAELEDQVIEAPGADGIEAGGGLVEEEDVRIERHRPRHAGPLEHPAADLGRVELLEARQADERELQRDDLPDLLRGELGEGLERQRHILGERHRAPERPGLVGHAEPAAEAVALLVRGVPEALAVVEDVALGRGAEADHVVEQRALPATAPAHDRRRSRPARS